MTQLPKEQKVFVESKFSRAVKAFADNLQVSCGGGNGFGSGALKVNGKIFALVSSQGEFVVKLPKERVEELVSKGQGERFDPGRGRIMKEWVVVRAGATSCVSLARDACAFVNKGGQ